MPTVKERTRDLRQNFRQVLNLDLIPATIITRDGQIIDPLIPNHYWVSYQTSNGLSTTRSVGGPAKSVPLKPGSPVMLETFRGRLRIRELDTDRLLAAGGDPVGTLQPRPDTTPQGNFETLRLVPLSGLTVSLKSWNIIIGGVYYEFSFPGVDLTSFVPSSGDMLYAVIAVLADLSDVEIATSTARLTSDLPLDVDDVNEAIASLSADSTPTWAVKLVGDQAEVTQADIDADAKDLRGIVNSSAATASVIKFDTIMRLATVAAVDMNTATATTLYTVPASVSCVIDHVVVRNASTSLTTASYSFGFNSATFNDVIANATHTELTGNTLYTALAAKAGAKRGAAEDTFKVLMNTLQGGAATTTMDVFGYLYA